MFENERLNRLYEAFMSIRYVRSPALAWRALSKAYCEEVLGYKPVAVESEQHFKEFLEKSLEAAKRHVASLERRGKDFDAEWLRHKTSVLATGLLAYGRLEAADYILDARLLRDGRRPPLIELLPLPDNINSFYWTKEVREWLNANRHRLQWDEAQGRFILKSD